VAPRHEKDEKDGKENLSRTQILKSIRGNSKEQIDLDHVVLKEEKESAKRPEEDVEEIKKKIKGDLVVQDLAMDLVAADHEINPPNFVNCLCKENVQKVLKIACTVMMPFHQK
jgi:hypothetical protein